MKYVKHIWAAFLFPLFTNAQSLPVTTGVPLPLADYRSKNIKQVEYALDLNVTGAPTTPIPATETIRFKLLGNSQPLQIDFKAPPDAISKLLVNGKTVKPDIRNEHLVIPMQWLRTGSNTVQIQFIAGSTSLNRNADYLYTLLVPEKARSVFPCFDQPNIKAVFQLTLQLPLAWQAIANGPLQDSVINANSKTYHFQPSDTISTYLFAFVAGNFAQTEVTSGNRTIHGLYRETDSAKLSASLHSLFAIQYDALTFMETYTGIPYPFKKFDFAAIPDFQFGGMEHPGAIEYKASTLFLEESATRDQLNARSNLLSHETAHMWFGDLVTMRWFNDVWMKEVFANFMADKIGNLTVSNNNFDLKFLTDHYPAAYNTDRTQGTHPIRQQLDNLKDAGSMYGNIIYHKAPIMMRQLELLMGEDSLREGLREYLRTYANRNASWPDLINILDKHCTANLQAWNKVWVNESSRPVFDYTMDTTGGIIQHFVLTQHAEDGSKKIWPQFFAIALVYEDHTEEITVSTDSAIMRLSQLSGRPVPQALVFNANGQGYGVFPATLASNTPVYNLFTPLMRASFYLNCYENALSGKGITPLQLIQLYHKGFTQEREELNLTLLLDQFSSVFWRFLSQQQRTDLAPALEIALWDAMNRNSYPNQQKLLLKAYSNIALTKGAQDTLFHIWQKKQPPLQVKLYEDDYQNLAATLAIRNYPGYDTVLLAQLQRIENADRKLRWQFLLPALSNDTAQRSQFFTSLQQRSNRSKEAWVGTALSYLHHPLRTSQAISYLPQSLHMLEEIQQTGDIFFPQNWLGATLGYYQTTAAGNIVRNFLKTHPGYNPKLRDKILQAADNIFRAEKLVK
ncbi:aminopeptidase N [Filimonas lacunae]|uniref:Aminopeptidase N n=1 Tax=Filimonas lacunae TaxID=477680 RepID=A0A173MLH3_9BACT|nr:M1 family aminopeptidase [Filimonas lacunae]BAV08330.1 membrane alanine aminopeptidase N [Filimonas lacunae]SIT33382.1 aminopeptidase N [Filimonas lacunae]